MIDVSPENLQALSTVPVVTVAIIALAIIVVIQAWAAIKQAKSMSDLTVAINNFVAYSDAKNQKLELAMTQQINISERIVTMIEKHREWSDNAVQQLKKIRS